MAPLKKLKAKEDLPIQAIQIKNASSGRFDLPGERIDAEHLSVQQQKIFSSPAVQQLRSKQQQIRSSIVQRQKNNTGLPDTMKQGMESLSGLSLDDVKVHYNSGKPAQLQAHAYTQGSNIHIAPGQERHLSHEAWHVVQQKQGRVRPTMQYKGAAINDDKKLESEADKMGQKASQLKAGSEMQPLQMKSAGGVVQRAGTKPRSFSTDGKYMIKLTSDREKFVYENAGALGLGGVMAGSHGIAGQTEGQRVTKSYIAVPHGVPIETVKRERVVTSVTIHKGGGTEDIQLKDPIDWPGPDQEILVIDTLGYEDPATVAHPASMNEKLIMDIKVGTYTKSGEQFELEQASVAKRFGKKLEHNFKDIVHKGSRSKGFDLEGQSKFEKMARIAKFARVKGEAGDNLTYANNFVLGLNKIITDIRAIETAVLHAGGGQVMTFVGSSILCVLNLRNPANSVAKLIDPDHPILLRDPGGLGAVPDDVMDQQKMADQNQGKFSWRQRNWNDYADKWKKSYREGMTKLIAYFVNKHSGL